MDYTLLKMVMLFGLAVAAGLLAFVVIWVLHDAFFFLETDMKFCRDCKHQGIWDCWRGVNKQVQVQVFSLVTGTPVNGKLHKFPPTCHEERHSLWPWRCGKKARFFEPRTESN